MSDYEEPESSNASSFESFIPGQRRRVYRYEKLIIAKKGTNPAARNAPTVGIKIRAGKVGYSEWMSEVQVYLLPNFKHTNILPALMNESNKYESLVGDGMKPLKHFEFEADDHRNRDSKRLKLEYWITLKYDQTYMTLRDYLKRNVVTWDQMLDIARGIMKGVYFLHENHEFQNFDVEEATRLFVESSQGWLKRVVFGDQERTDRTVYAVPPMHLSVIHRNLSSENIILKPDLTPCIWNFGYAFISYPFQPLKKEQRVKTALRDVQMTSYYSAPEVLMQSAPGSLPAYKAVDMYACGIILWELLTRTSMPCLPNLTLLEISERSGKMPFREPYADQFGPFPTTGKLVYAVCYRKCRPSLRRGWLRGRKSSRMVEILQHLWDCDFDARLHSATVITRLERLKTDKDPDQYLWLRHPGTKRLNVYESFAWTKKSNEQDHLAPLPTRVDPNIRVLSDDERLVMPKIDVPKFLQPDEREESDDNGYLSDDTSQSSGAQQSGGGGGEWIEMSDMSHKMTILDVKTRLMPKIRYDL